ncbi:branched-chain amino acid ABC transporter substrate-binding protein [Paraburkholderia sp. D15]|uniref:branched-chain amino acid ABC transporter substrate-binding protein n=1 Tax=Paraburkholderia sp. D15 TaxID=2880218 RepID=UPI002479578C|nr:branched-chain amino acid ABC transporter substrate-binding protein [Paraburkholderia sp. D15]WGS54687.1 branched-chain amino acid ABC transporter substrate-binding protein [Paraburkholderia sp. D15]
MKKTIVTTAVLAGATLGHAASAGQAVSIGFAGPLTGANAQIGKDAENGARLAIEEANAAGIRIHGQPVEFQLLAEDDAADPRMAVTVAQKLVDAGVVGMVGHVNSGATLPASRIYANAGIPQISPAATNPDFTRQGFPTAFRVIGDDSYVGRVLGQYMARETKIRRLAVIDDRTAYGQGLADVVVESFKANGGTVVDREYVTANTTDFRGVLTKAKSSQADAIFYGGVDAQGGPLRKQMTSLAMTMPLIGSGLETDKFLELAGGANGTDGTLSAEPGEPLDDVPGGNAFKSRFSKYGKVVLFAPFSYDAAWALINAMKRADSTVPAVYLPQLRKVDFAGVTGRIAFDAKGDLLSAPVTLYQAKSGHFAPIGTTTLK